MNNACWMRRPQANARALGAWAARGGGAMLFAMKRNIDPRRYGC